MSETRPEYRVKRPGNNGKERFFPVKIDDNEKLLEFLVRYIKFPLSQGVNQIHIHSDGSGIITRTEEVKMNK